MGCGANKSLADTPKQFFSLKSCDISSTRLHLLLVRGRRKLPPLSSSQKKFPPPPCVNYRWKNDAHMAIRDCHRARKINPTSFRALLFIAKASSQVYQMAKTHLFVYPAPLASKERFHNSCEFHQNPIRHIDVSMTLVWLVEIAYPVNRHAHPSN
nr:WD and tetratricopeptide repeats protein 1 isoform X1 [Ipomoea batatas]